MLLFDDNWVVLWYWYWSEEKRAKYGSNLNSEDERKAATKCKRFIIVNQIQTEKIGTVSFVIRYEVNRYEPANPWRAQTRCRAEEPFQTSNCSLKGHSRSASTNSLRNWCAFLHVLPCKWFGHRSVPSALCICHNLLSIIAN